MRLPPADLLAQLDREDEELVEAVASLVAELEALVAEARRRTLTSPERARLLLLRDRLGELRAVLLFDILDQSAALRAILAAPGGWA